MNSTIIEEIIYGNWLTYPVSEREVSMGRRGVHTIRNGERSAREKCVREWKELVRYFSIAGEEAQEILTEADFPQKNFTPEQLLFYPEKAPPDSAFTLQLNRLLELEACRLMGLVMERVCGSDSEGDHFYIVTLAMRKWSDYLVDLVRLQGEFSNISGQTQTASLPEELRKWLIVLICDLSERYAGLNLKEHFNREEIYPVLLNRRAPNEPEIFAIVAWVERKGGQMASHLMENGPDEVQYQRFLDELQHLSKEVRGLDIASAVVTEVHHVEDLILLSYWQKPAFMEKNRENLVEPRAAAEWVRGVREEALDQMSKSMKKTLKKLWSIKQQMKPFLDAGDGMGLSQASGDSESRRFMTEMEQMDRALFQQPFNDSSENLQTAANKESNPFMDQAGEKYMSKEHMIKYLKIDHRSTRNTFLKKAGFRYVELTDQKQLVYIEDIEAYLEKNTKRYGDDE